MLPFFFVYLLFFLPIVQNTKSTVTIASALRSSFSQFKCFLVWTWCRKTKVKTLKLAHIYYVCNIASGVNPICRHFLHHKLTPKILVIKLTVIMNTVRRHKCKQENVSCVWSVTKTACGYSKTNKFRCECVDINVLHHYFVCFA